MRKLLAVALALALTSGAFAQQINGGGSGGGGGGSGTVTSIATTCGVSGGTITTTGTLSSNSNPNVQAGANYAILTGDCGSIIYLNNAAPQVPTIAQAGSAGFLKGYYVELCNIGAGTQTITPTTSTIGGAATYVLAAGSDAAPKCVGVNSDGTNYTLDLTGVGGSTSFANPTATASDTANNGVAATAMRSDASPAVQKGTNAQFGLAEGDNTSISMTTGVVSTKAFTGDCTTSAASVATNCKSLFQFYNTATPWILAGGSDWSGGGSNSATGSNIIRCYPGRFFGTATLSALGVRIGTVSAGGFMQVAIYNNNPSTNRPGTLLVASHTGAGVGFSTTTATNLSQAISQQITGTVALQWYCSNFDNGTATAWAVGVTNTGITNLMGTATQANLASSGSAFLGGLQYSTQTFGTWPDLSAVTPTSELNSGNGIPQVQLKIGSIP